MNHCQDEMKAAVKAGDWNLFSFNPALKAEGKSPFTLSSKPGDGSYQAFLANETRYSSLARKFPDRAADPKPPPKPASTTSRNWSNSTSRRPSKARNTDGDPILGAAVGVLMRQGMKYQSYSAPVDYLWLIGNQVLPHDGKLTSLFVTNFFVSCPANSPNEITATCRSDSQVLPLKAEVSHFHWAFTAREKRNPPCTKTIMLRLS